MIHINWHIAVTLPVEDIFILFRTKNSWEVFWFKHGWIIMTPAHKNNWRESSDHSSCRYRQHNCISLNLPARFWEIRVQNSVPLLPSGASQCSRLLSHWDQSFSIWPRVSVENVFLHDINNFMTFGQLHDIKDWIQDSGVTWNSKGDVGKYIFTCVVALQHDVCLKHLLFD